MTLSQLEVTGAEIYAVTVANKLIENSHTVFIMSDTLTASTAAHYIPMPFNKRGYLNRFAQIVRMVKFIRLNGIDVIHTHSRAAGWVSYFASRICNIPLITTVHGERHVHVSSLMMRLFGDRAISICENITNQLTTVFRVKSTKIVLIRNPLKFYVKDEGEFDPNNPDRQMISVIGRLSGPKAEVISKILKLLTERFAEYELTCVGGGKEYESLKAKYGHRVKFIGFVRDIRLWFDQSRVVIGSGRVAAEAIARGRATVAVGESCPVGFVTEENLKSALSSNFGDICQNHFSGDYTFLANEIVKAIQAGNSDKKVVKIVREEFGADKIVNKIRDVYLSEWVYKKEREIPVLMYHRVVKDKSEAGKHGIYVTTDQFEMQMIYLKERGYRTITFNELDLYGCCKEKERNVILTFDDGYEDNYTNMFPILKKYGFKAVIFVLGGLSTNIWDAGRRGEPELNLLNDWQISQMAEYGIQFGSHGLSHRRLTVLNDSELYDEIAVSKQVIEKRVGRYINTFCYPYGDVDERVKKFVRDAGYEYGVATDTGPLAIHEDKYHVRRIAVFPDTTLLRFARKVKGNYNFKRVKRVS
ncbi:MAG: polysaccharide deacetylase family protein [Candidatus Kryptoniota bacterium]